MSVPLIEAVLRHAEAVPDMARLLVQAATCRHPQVDPEFYSLFDQALALAHRVLGMEPPLTAGEHIIA